MRFYLVIPVDLDLPDTKRATIKAAGKNHILNMARDPEGTAEYLRTKVNQEDYLVRTPSEKTYRELELSK